MKKSVLVVLISLVVLLVAGFFAGQSWLKGQFKKENIVAQMEAAWNCRAQLDETTLNLGTSPATVVLHGLKIAPRDAEVGKPLSQRAPFPEPAALLSSDSVSLAVSLGDLISRKANIKKLHISGLNLRAEVDHDGVSNLDLMFESAEDAAVSAEEEASASAHTMTEPAPSAAIAPAVADTAGDAASAPATDPAGVTPPAPAAEVPSVTGKGGGTVKRKKVKKEKKPFLASDLPLSLQAEEASVDNARFEIVDLKSETHTVLEHVSFALKGIDVNPGDLANHNHCGFEFAGGIRVSSPDPNSVATNFDVSGSGTLEPFEVQTGVWRPDLTLAVTVKKGGLLGGVPLSSQMKPKDLAKLKEFGLDLSSLAIGGVLQEDATTEVHAVGSKLIVKKDTRLAFPQYDITLMSDSWFNSPEDLHILRGRLLASPELTTSILSGAQKTLTDRLGESLASIAIATVTATLLDHGRLAIPFKSKGKLSKPDVSLDTAMSGATDALKDAGKSLLEGLLGK